MTRTSYTDTRVVDFPDGARIETTTTYYPPPGARPDPDPRLAGVHDARPPDKIRSVFPGTVLTRPFVSGVLVGPRSLIPAVEKACRPSWTADLLPTYSLKLNREEVMTGAWDPYIRELGDWHVDTPPAELIIYHEPENDTELQNGAFPPYFNRVAAQFRTANDRIPLLYAALGYQWLPGNTDGTVKGWTSQPTHWQGVECDRHTIDIYSGNYPSLYTILPEHRGFRRWMELVVRDQPWGVSERGFVTFADHQGRAEQIRRELNWLLADPAARGCRRYLYWNTTGTENNPNLVLDQKHGEPAVRELITAVNARPGG